MKKILSLVLAIMMVLSMATTVFATTFEDVDAENAVLTDAATALNGLKIITGYEDGTFKPEKVVTRAEMAAMLIRARGYESIATDTPSFVDSQNHWAKGYISLASDLGIINGRGNGIFDPDATVTYQEAAVMMLRALGYTDESINNGKSIAYIAANYRTKALSLGLFNDLGAFTMANGANRGQIAVMLNNNLTNQMVFTGENGRPVYDGTKLLLDSIAVVEPNFEVTVAQLSKGHLVDLSDYLYQYLEVYKNEDGKVVYVKETNSTTYTGLLNKTLHATADKLNVYISSTDTKVVTLADPDNVTVFYNGAITTMSKANLEGKATAKVVLTTDAIPTVKGIVMEEINATKKVSRAYISGKTAFETYNLPLDKDGKVDFSKITVIGDATSLADIAKNDIIQVCKAANDSVFKFYVTRNTLEGKISEITAKNTAGTVATKIIVDNVEYSVALIAGSDAAVLGAEGLFYLNKSGAIVYFAAGEEEVEYNYAIITGVANGTVSGDAFNSANRAIATYPKVRMVGMDGKTVVKELAVAINADGTIKTAVTGFTITPNGAPVNALTTTLAADTGVINTDQHVVEYTENADGRITGVEAVTVIDKTAAADAMKTTNVNFLATDSTVVLNLTSNGYALTSLDKLKATVNYYAVGNSIAWDLLVVADGVVTSNDGVYAVVTKVTETLNADGKSVQKVEAFVDGVKVTYLTSVFSSSVAKVVDTTNQVGIVLDFTTNASGVLTLVAPASTEAVATPTAITSGRIVLKDVPGSFKLDEEVVVYKQASNNSVSIGDLADVEFAFNDQVVEIYDVDGNGTIDIIFIRK